MKKRCKWANPKNPLYIKYHDNEWGRPVRRDKKHFEMICLEGAQAGLSWEMILNKRACYQKHFVGFDPAKVAKFSIKRLEKILLDPGIVRNRLKIYSVIVNAKAFLKVQKEFGSFNKYIWQFVGGKPIVNCHKKVSDLPAQTCASDAMSKDLKKRGFKFIGSTTCYAYMQATGMVNDHTVDCYRYGQEGEYQIPNAPVARSHLQPKKTHYYLTHPNSHLYQYQHPHSKEYDYLLWPVHD